MLRKTFNATAAAAAIALSLTACGGGGGGTSALPSTGAPSTGSPTQDKTGQASMTIKIPAKAASASSKAQYISASTKSMTIGIVNGSKTTQVAEVDLTPTSSACSAQPGGGLQCNVVFVGPAGPNMYVLSMYDQTGGKGNLLSTGNVSIPIVAGQNTNVPIALDGVPVSASVVLGTSTLPVGNAGSTSVIVVAKDSGGNIIVGPGGFSTPIALTIGGDTYKTLSLSSTSVTSPGQAITLAYTGGTNIGSTITATVGSKTGSASFAGTGAATNIFSYSDAADHLYGYGYAVQNIPNSNTAAMVMYIDHSNCCFSSLGGIAIVGPNGVQKVFVGDMTNPNTTDPTTYTGVTLVHGMSQTLQTWAGDDVAKEIAVAPNGNIYYAGSYTLYNPPTCASNWQYNNGTIGVLNPTARTAAEQVTKGAPMYMQLDPSGNLWFLEQSPYCNGTGQLQPRYYIGELSAGGTLTETDFATAGLPTDYPGTMQLSNDGKTMYIGDDNAGSMMSVALPALGTPLTVALTNSAYPYATAMAPDGTLLWSSDTEPGEHYMYGYIPGGKSFLLSNVVENALPIHSETSYGIASGDGSFWVGNDYNSGIVRLSGWTNGSMQSNWFQFPWPDDDAPEITGVADNTNPGNGGYVYAGDDEYGNIYVMQYGAPGTTTITSNAKTAQTAAVAPMSVKHPMGALTLPRNEKHGPQGNVPMAARHTGHH